MLLHTTDTDTSTSTNANQTNSPLLRLPAELRYWIYSLAVETTLTLSKSRNEWGYDAERIPSPLLFTCRQIRDETDRIKSRTVLRFFSYTDTECALYALRTCCIGADEIHALEFTRTAVRERLEMPQLQSLRRQGWTYEPKRKFPAVDRVSIHVPKGISIPQLEECKRYYGSRDVELVIVGLPQASKEL